MADDSSYENLRIDYDDSVALVTIDSTSRINALNPTMAGELLDAAAALVEDETVRCIALTGSGGVFGAGADLGQLNGDETDGPPIRRLASTLHDSITQLHQAEKPLVVGVNGVAAGAGFSLAITGDVVLISDEARMEYAYSRIGLTGDGGSTFFLPRLVGLRRAKEIVLLDQKITPERAVELGLATEVVPADEFDDRLVAIARQLADGPTKALGTTKRLLTESFDSGLESQMAAETDAIAKSTHTEDFKRGHAAFFGDEDAEFVGR